MQIMFKDLNPSIASFLSQISDMMPHFDALEATVRENYQKLQQEQLFDEALTSLQILRRCFNLSVIGKVSDPSLVNVVTNDLRFPLWKDYEGFPAKEEDCQTIADLLYDGDSQKREPVLLYVSDYTRPIAKKLISKLIETNTDFDIYFYDQAFSRFLLSCCSEENAQTLGQVASKRRSDCERIINLIAGNGSTPLPKIEIDEAVRKAYAKSARRRGKFYTLTYLPTPEDAKLDQIPYDEYVDLYMRMCTVDWDAVSKAHEALIECFNKGKQLRITNSDGTDVTMDIEGFTFANSLVAKNIPGSEIFSAPRRDSVNGTIVAKGRFMPKTADEIVEDITLEFKDGYLETFSAEKGQETLEKVFSIDEGARYVGELGIGTNPVLRQHVVNGLLVEKISGSFHLALGAAYEYKEYEGVPVKLDNGNRSALHWDVTTMLYGKDGQMILDGEVVMENGLFTDPRLSILNGAE